MPKKIRENFGDKLQFLPNARAAVVYPENTKPEDVIASLQVIIADLQIRGEMEK